MVNVQEGLEKAYKEQVKCNLILIQNINFYNVRVTEINDKYVSFTATVFEFDKETIIHYVLNIKAIIGIGLKVVSINNLGLDEDEDEDIGGAFI